MHNNISAQLGGPHEGRGRGSPFQYTHTRCRTGPRLGIVAVRRDVVAAVLVLAAGGAVASTAVAQQTPQQAGANEGGNVPQGTKNGDWVLPGRTYQMTRYSPLTQITTSNVNNLK